MNTCHGTWGIGFVLGTLIGTGARTWDVSPLMHLGLVGAGGRGADADRRPADEGGAAPAAQRAGRAHALSAADQGHPGLVGFIIASVIVENGAMSWSVIYFRDAFDVPSYIESLSLPLYMLAISVGRLLNDNWVERWGPARVASVLSIVALVGLVPVAWAGSLPLAIIGFVLIGFGDVVCVPAVDLGVGADRRPAVGGQCRGVLDDPADAGDGRAGVHRVHRGGLGDCRGVRGDAAAAADCAGVCEVFGATAGGGGGHVAGHARGMASSPAACLGAGIDLAGRGEVTTLIASPSGSPPPFGQGRPRMRRRQPPDG